MAKQSVAEKRKFRLRVLGRNDTWEWRYFPTFAVALRYAKSISYEDDELPVIYRKEGSGWVGIPGWEDRYLEYASKHHRELTEKQHRLQRELVG